MYSLTNIKQKTYEYYRFIPKGPKKQLDFTYDEKGNYCVYLVTLNKHNNNSKKTKQYISFDPVLCNGTKINGTFMNYENVNYFFIEDILIYKGNNVKYKKWKEKFQMMNDILNYINFNIFTPKQKFALGFPVTRISLSELQKLKLHYELYSIECLYENKKIFVKMANQIKDNTIKTFFVRPHIQPDIYTLYTENEVGYACIPDYKTSKMLNHIFRNVPENDNLDVLEESEDEEDFENVEPDKHVNLRLIKRFKCKYNQGFKLWVPCELVEP